MADRKPPPAAPRAAAAPAGKPAVAGKPAAAESDGAAAQPEGRLSWILGWIVAPASVIGAIYGGGVILGAHNPDGWFARSVMWVVGLF